MELVREQGTIVSSDITGIQETIKKIEKQTPKPVQTPGSALAMLRADEKYPTGGCDKHWCDARKTYYKISPGKTWGSAPPSAKRGWFTHQCSKPSKQNNAKCVVKDAPSKKKTPEEELHVNPEHLKKPRCDRSWCEHHRMKHSITPGKGWGTAPPKVKHRWFHKRNCVYVKRQNNLGCAKESAMLADKKGPQKIPVGSNCDSDWCDHVVKKYKVLPGKSWGSANRATQKGWFTHHCSVPKEQNLSGCAGANDRMPGLPPGPEDKAYDKNAGKWGGTRL